MTDKADDGVALPLPATDTGSAARRVLPGPLAAALGYAVACLVLASIATAVVGWGTARDFWGYVWTVIVAAFYAAGLGLFTALPVALILGWSLRRVMNQGIHVLAFFLVPTLIAWLIIGLIVQSAMVPLLMGAAVGLSMAAGRAAIWPLARAYP